MTQAICPCCGNPTIIDRAGDCSCIRCDWEFTTIVRSGEQFKSNPFIAGTDLSAAYEKGWQDALNVDKGNLEDAADIIDLLKTVIETELINLGLPTEATPTSGLGRARAFIRGRAS